MEGFPMRTKLVLAAGLLTLAAPAWGDDWPQFRGPDGAGVSADGRLPAEWGPQKNVAWKVKLTGYGWSCPVVVGGKVFVTSASSEKQKKPTGQFGPPGGGFPKGGPGGFPKGGRAPNEVYKWELHCLDAAGGKLLWSKAAAECKPAVGTNPTNGYATETPAADAERVYAYFGGIGKLFCYDHAGKHLWTAEVGAHPTQFGHGSASSPVAAGGRVFVQCDNEEKSFLLALDAKTGKELWRTPRSERTAWSTPLVWKAGDRTEVVCAGSPSVRAYDPDTGKQLWEMGGVAGQIKASPVAGEGLLFVGSPGGFGGGFGRPAGGGGGRPGMGGSKSLAAVKAEASGNITPKSGAATGGAVAWRVTTAGPGTASPLVYKGYLYVPEERGGLVACYDAKTGKEQYRERVPKARNFTASPWACAGKVFLLDDAGTTHVLKAGPEFEVLGENRLGEMSWSSPAIADGALFLRTVDHLYCIRAAK
jgi:outer membrane protein assembly factor BamB